MTFSILVADFSLEVTRAGAVERWPVHQQMFEDVQEQLFNQVTSWQVNQVATILVCLEPGEAGDFDDIPCAPGEHLAEGVARLLPGERLACCPENI